MMNVNREGKFKISVMKSNKNTIEVVKERTLEGTRQYNNRTRSVFNPLTISKFYSKNMNDPRASTRSHYSNYPFNRKKQFNNNFQGSRSAACPINTQYWPSHTQSEYDYSNGPNYYEYGHNHSNFCPPVNVHTVYFNQNQPNANDYSQYNYSEEYSCQNNYYGQNPTKSSYQNYYCEENAEFYQKSRMLVTISSNFQQQNNKKQSIVNKLSIDKKQNGFKGPVYQKKLSSIKHIQDMKKVDRCPRTEQISQTNTSSTNKYEPIDCEIIDLCEENTNENCPTTMIKIKSDTKTVSEEDKRKKNPETNAANNQDLCKIKDVLIETNVNCAKNTIKIKTGTETVSEEIKRKENPETIVPNNQDLCEIKDVSLETNEDCATNTIKIKSGTKTVSKEVKRKKIPETNASNNQDLCKIKDVSIETNVNCAKNTIEIKNDTENVSGEIKKKENPETIVPKDQDLCEIKDVSIETNEDCGTNAIKIKSGNETVSEEVKRKNNPETNAPNNQDLFKIKDISIETNVNCAKNAIKIKKDTETVSGEIKGKENPETIVPNNQDLCEIKDVSIETNENCATNTIKIKNSTETNAPNNRDLCEIKDVSIETKDNCQTNKEGQKYNCDEVSSSNITDYTNESTNPMFRTKIIDIINEIVEVTSDCKTNASGNKTLSNNINQVFSRDTTEVDPQTESKKTYHNITNLSNETTATYQKNVSKIKICSDCKEVFPCNTQQNCEQNIKVTKKNRDTQILKIGKGLATTNKSYSCATKSIDHHKKSNLLPMNKSLDPNILTRKDIVETLKCSKFLKVPENDISDSGNNILNKDTNDLCKKKTYIDIFSKQKIDASYKIPKLSKCKIKNKSEAIETTLLKSNNTENNKSEEKKDVKVIDDIKSTKKNLKSHGSSTYNNMKVKKPEKYVANKKLSIANLSRDVKTINKYKQLKCNNETNKISHEKRDVNVIRVTNSIKNTAVSPKTPTNLKNTERKETSIDKISRNDKVSKRIEIKHYDTAKSIHYKSKHANDKNINTTDGEKQVSCNKDVKERNTVKNKTESGDKSVSKINEANKRKLTLDDSCKDKKKHKVETGKLTSKTKTAIVKTCNEQFNTLKSIVHVSNQLVVEKQNKQNRRHKTSNRNERLTTTLKEDRDDLLITVDKDKKIKVNANVKDEKRKNKKHTKQNSNLNIIINIKYPEKTSKQKCTKETYSVEDLSFLDDFNVDEIVKSLNNC